MRADVANRWHGRRRGGREGRAVKGAELARRGELGRGPSRVRNARRLTGQR